MKDAHNSTAAVATLVPATQTATLKGTAVDLRGYGTAELVINTGAIVGAGLYVVSLQESDTTTDGDFTDVAAADQLGTLPASLAASTVYNVGYVGKHRYVRAVITKTSGTSIDAGAVVVLGAPALAPV